MKEYRHVPDKQCAVSVTWCIALYSFILDIFVFWDAHVAILGQPLLISEMCTLGAASSSVGEPQNQNFHVSIFQPLLCQTNPCLL